MKAIWMLAGYSALGLGVIGLILPLLPTVPFLLLAAFCFARSSEKIHSWLIEHPKFGPPIRDWNERGAISKPAKNYATISVAAAFGLSLILGLKPLVLVIQGLCLACVLLFIWSRPSV